MYEDSVNEDQEFFEIDEESKQSIMNFQFNQRHLELENGMKSRIKANSFMVKSSYPRRLADKRTGSRKLSNKKLIELIKLPPLVEQPDQPKSDSNENSYIQKAFGRHFEFSEKYLVSEIDSNKIKRAIKRRYRFKKVTRATLKHILYEGAKTNDILRINDESYQKMVDALDLPLDPEEPEPRKSSEAMARYQIADESINIVNPNEDVGEHLKRSAPVGKSSPSLDSYNIESSNKNTFLEAKESLQRIFEFENENPEILQSVASKSKSKYPLR